MIGDIIILEEWKSVSMVHGEKSVMTIGKTEMQVLSACSLDFLMMVYILVAQIRIPIKVQF